jgi:hypothetical protein
LVFIIRKGEIDIGRGLSKFSIPFTREGGALIDGISPPGVKVVWFGNIALISSKERKALFYSHWEYHIPQHLLVEGGGGETAI